jgi:hypothetical protein
MFKMKFLIIDVIILLGILVYPCNAQIHGNYFVGKWFSIDNYNNTDDFYIWEFTEMEWIWDNAEGAAIPRDYRILGNRLVIEKLEYPDFSGYILDVEIIDQDTFILLPSAASTYPTIDNVQTWKRLPDSISSLSGIYYLEFNFDSSYSDGGFIQTIVDFFPII